MNDKYIEQDNYVFNKESEYLSDGHFMTLFNRFPDISFTEITMDRKVIDRIREMEGWEVIGVKSFFNNEVNKIVHRVLKDDDKELSLTDEMIDTLSDVLLFKKDNVGLIRVDISDFIHEPIIMENELEEGFIDPSWKLERTGLGEPTLDTEDEENTKVSVDFSFVDTDEARRTIEELLKDCFAYEEKEDKAQVNIISQSPDGLYTLNEFQIDYEEINFDTYYNDGLEGFHEKMMGNLQTKDEQSFFILHGEPGTGKTSYIRYLMGQLGAKETIIYLPPTMVGALSDPSFINFISNNSRSILIIEDAEEVVKNNPDGRSPALNNLLNLTDGILGNCFELDVICTFNADINDIDFALKRKGRLTGIFRFETLEEEKVKALCEELNIEVPESKENWTLGYLMNSEEEDLDYKGGSNEIGFNRNS